MEIVDAQVHIWAADTPERPWPPGTASRAHRPVPLGHEGLLVEMAEAGVGRAVLVPPSYEGDRNDLVLAAAGAHPDRFAAMGRIAVEDPASAAQVKDWRRQPGMLGIRLTFHLPVQKKWLEDGTADWFWPLAQAEGIPLMILPTGTVPAMGVLAERYPDLRIIIDHCSLHRVLGEPPHLDHDEIAKLVALARHPNIAVKASSMPLFSSDSYPFRDVHDTIHRVFDAFGPDRTFWGSDVTRMPCSYRQCVTLFTEELPWLHGKDLEKVMGQALRKWLRWA